MICGGLGGSVMHEGLSSMPYTGLRKSIDYQDRVIADFAMLFQQRIIIVNVPKEQTQSTV